MNNILLIDDRADFATQFVELANSEGIKTTHRRSFIGLKEILPTYHHKYAAVILDIKCLLKDDQEKEDASFITVALAYLDQNLPGFPRFILTGDDNEFETFERYFINEKVFLKTPDDIGKLMRDVKFCVDNSETLKIKRENSIVFEIFKKGLMNNNAEIQLLKILQTGLIEKDPRKFKGILVDIRSMQEGIYKSINSRNSNVVPNSMLKTNGMIKFNELMKHLNGNVFPPLEPTRTVYQNPTIFQLANSLYWSCGEYIHEDPKRKYFISEYAIKSLINNLMELLLWSKQY